MESLNRLTLDQSMFLLFLSALPLIMLKSPAINTGGVALDTTSSSSWRKRGERLWSAGPYTPTNSKNNREAFRTSLVEMRNSPLCTTPTSKQEFLKPTNKPPEWPEAGSQVQKNLSPISKLSNSWRENSYLIVS
jgi:hypothetical protein